MKQPMVNMHLQQKNKKQVKPHKVLIEFMTHFKNEINIQYYQL